MVEQTSGSTVVRFSDVAYYMHDVPEVGHTIGAGQVREPCTVIEIGNTEMSPKMLCEIIARFGRSDDVWSKEFLRSVVIQSHGRLSSLQPNGKLHPAYRLYPDTSGSFIVATVPTRNPIQYKPLDAVAYGETYPSALTIAVPSRLHFTKTDEQPYAGFRVGIKDIIDLKGLRTGASSRSYTKLYGPREQNAAVVQKLLRLGFVVVGKLKTTQFADSEWATCDWIDYHAPFNPRADGYQGPSGSSAGSAAAIATYDWLDFTIGTDTLGSIRGPATVQGIFGMRSSIGALSFDGIVPYSDKFDTVGGFARDAEAFAKLSNALYGPVAGSGCKKKVTKILYPVDYWPVKHEESQAVFEKFIETRVNLEEVWQKTNPVQTNLCLSEYFEHVFEWVANPDQWTGFMKGFLEDYRTTFGKAAVVNPQLQFKRDYLPTVTKEQQNKGIELLNMFRSWWEKNVIPSADGSGCTDTIMRDKYRESAQNFTGIGFFFYNLSPYAGAPELIVPAGQTSYMSRLSECNEFLPAAIGITGSKGSDVALAELVNQLLGTENSVEAGPVAFKVVTDETE
ncbi:putative glutamyl-tRNA amidotransferase subunit A [Mollisia scopiformis]|uniref:Putative glutamyl-tRNA amidotransferase subunit A n=1 Tax=Mollisia scopiformis TaxID=149040 RepID=A0A194X297_MOLSC|nr:putative glutamyl-tRNA amidotransferase subunit A [Mollisia scopiformis]KUJ13957.1 putative glutamyl-tRNA amidotransferase subunit A [Mollisia scopiformis]